MASFVDSLKKVFSFREKGAILGVDIGSSSIKVALIEKVEEKVILRNYGEMALGPSAELAVGQATNLPPEKIALALRDLLKETKISSTRTFIAIPFNASLLSVIELPDVGQKELNSMIPIEARRYIPVPITEVSLDWWVLPKRNAGHSQGAAKATGDGVEKSEGKVEVIIAAIHNEVISKFESIKRDAQLPGGQSHFEIEIFSTLRAVVGRDLAPILVIDIGAGSTKLALVDEGVVRASHVISMGGQDITLGLARSQDIPFAQAEELKRRVGMVGDNEGRDVLAVAELLFSNVMSETLRFVGSYEHKHGIKVSKIILVGGGSRLQGVEKIITQSFPSVTVLHGDPFARVDAPEFLAKTLKEIGPNFATALGVALKGLE